MAGDIGSAVNLLKQLLADDKAKDTLSGLLGGLMGNGENTLDSLVTSENAIEEIADEEVIDAQIAAQDESLGGLLPGILGNMDVQGIYNSMVGCDDKRIVLLNSLRPYLNKKRCAKIDSAITILQLLSISSSLGIDKMFGR